MATNFKVQEVCFTAFELLRINFQKRNNLKAPEKKYFPMGLGKVGFFILELFTYILCVMHLLIAIDVVMHDKRVIDIAMNQGNDTELAKVIVEKKGDLVLGLFFCLPSLCYVVTMSIWRFWINRRNNIFVYALKQIEATKNVKQTLNVKSFMVLIIISVLKFLGCINRVWMSLSEDTTDNIGICMYLFFMQVSLEFQQFPLLLICTYLSCICQSVSVELDTIGDELRQIKSPYKAVKSIKNAMEKYKNMKNLSQDANLSLTMPLFMFSASNFIAIPLVLFYLANSFSRKPDDFMVYSLLYNGVLNFLFGLDSLYFCSRVNFKRGQLMAAITAQMVQERPIPLPLITSFQTLLGYYITIEGLDDYFGFRNGFKLKQISTVELVCISQVKIKIMKKEKTNLLTFLNCLLLFPNVDESLIQNFLNICEDVEKTKQRITRYYQLRLQCPQIMANFDSLYGKDLKLIKQKALFCDFTKENSNDPFLGVAFASKIEADDTIYDAFGTLMLVGETCLLHSPRFRKHGGIMIVDFQEMKFNHILQCTPSLALIALKCFLEGIPIKFHQVHFISTGYMLKAAFSVAIRLLSPELSKIVWIHSGSWESLENYIRIEDLRLVYDDHQDNDEIFKTEYEIMMKYRDYILDDAKYGFMPIREDF
ncbi:hypothetical protein CHUAL_008578 [Chamberlinius hualienensis]